ncbi:MAG: hypothetical protein WCK42_01610 [Myxococcaceae bacterium]
MNNVPPVQQSVRRAPPQAPEDTDAKEMGPTSSDSSEFSSRASTPKSPTPPKPSNTNTRFENIIPVRTLHKTTPDGFLPSRTIIGDADGIRESFLKEHPQSLLNPHYARSRDEEIALKKATVPIEMTNLNEMQTEEDKPQQEAARGVSRRAIE